MSLVMCKNQISDRMLVITVGLGGPEGRYGPPATNQSALNHAFEAWLEESGIAPDTAGCTPYVGCVYNTSLMAVVEGGPREAAAFYYSKRFAHDFGLRNASCKHTNN